MAGHTREHSWERDERNRSENYFLLLVRKLNTGTCKNVKYWYFLPYRTFYYLALLLSTTMLSFSTTTLLGVDKKLFDFIQVIFSFAWPTSMCHTRDWYVGWGYLFLVHSAIVLCTRVRSQWLKRHSTCTTCQANNCLYFSLALHTRRV